jgi:hypothetical protein
MSDAPVLIHQDPVVLLYEQNSWQPRRMKGRGGILLWVADHDGGLDEEIPIVEVPQVRQDDRVQLAGGFALNGLLYCLGKGSIADFGTWTSANDDWEHTGGVW